MGAGHARPPLNWVWLKMLYIFARKTITRFSLFSGKVLRRNLLKRTSNGGTVILGPG
jgi:hypothetical protein